MQDSVKEKGIEFGTAKSDAFVMRWFRFGTGSRTMVILPGLSVQSVMGSAEAVADEYAMFNEEFTVYVFDRRDELTDTYSIAGMAEDTAEAFALLGLRNIHLFGASQGGMIAMKITQDHPELIAKLFLGSTACRVTDKEFGAISDWVSLAKKKDRTGLYLSFGEKLYPSVVFDQYEAVFRTMAETVTDKELERFIILAEGTKGFDVSDRMDLITCPVFFADADDDRVLGQEAGRLIRENLENSPVFRSFTYSGYGHACFDTAAPEYQQRMFGFFLEQQHLGE